MSLVNYPNHAKVPYDPVDASSRTTGLEEGVELSTFDVAQILAQLSTSNMNVRPLSRRRSQRSRNRRRRRIYVNFYLGA